jgi:hypothetical protein
VIGFRIDDHFIKRGALISNFGHPVTLGVDLHAFAFRPK